MIVNEHQQLAEILRSASLEVFGSGFCGFSEPWPTTGNRGCRCLQSPCCYDCLLVRTFRATMISQFSRMSAENPSQCECSWSVWRQDDNGNRFEITRGLSRKAAQGLVKDFEQKGHKQTYWIEPTASLYDGF